MTTVSFIIKSHVRDDAHSLIGGAAKNPYRLVKYLARKLTVREVVYFDGEHSGHEPYRARGYKTRLLKLYPKTLYQNVISAAAVLRAFGQSDVVQCHHPHYGLAAAVFRRLGCGRARFVVKAHGTAVPELRANSYSGIKGWILAANAAIHRWHDRFVLASADAVLCSSEFQRQEMQTIYGLAPAIVHCIYNGFDADYAPPARPTRQHASAQDLRVVFCGRVVPKKGIEHAIALFQRLAGQAKHARLVLILGRRQEIEDRATYKKVQLLAAADPRIVIKHDLSEAALYQEFAAASLGLVTSQNYESIPTVVIEMLASALPVFATYSWGIPEILPEQFGLRGESEYDVRRIEAFLQAAPAGKPGAWDEIRTRFDYSTLIHS